jgi:uncharacterized protein
LRLFLLHAGGSGWRLAGVLGDECGPGWFLCGERFLSGESLIYWLIEDKGRENLWDQGISIQNQEGQLAMKIGILSDSHDHVTNIKKAAGIFSNEGVQLILHGGDHVAPFSLGPLKEVGCRVIGVFGNNDGEKILLSRHYQSLGEVHEGPHFIRQGDYRIALMHEPFALDELLASEKFDLIVYGHTHQKDIRKEKGILINPGECCGWVYNEPSIAVVDLESKEISEFML